MKIYGIGGFNEVEKNMTVVDLGEDAIVFDCGLFLPPVIELEEADKVYSEIKLKSIGAIPADDLLDKEGLRNKVRAIIPSHAHLDHVGGVPYIAKRYPGVPIYGTPFTLGVVRKKLEEHNLFLPVSLHEISHRSTLELGAFELEFIRVCHSAVDGVGVAIKTPRGLVIHTGDFKIGHTSAAGMITDVNKFAQYGEKGVLALLSDSTNVEREGYTISDQEVGDTLGRISAGRKGRIIIGLFASSITRIQQVVDIAKAINRKVIFNGRSIETSVSIAKELG